MKRTAASLVAPLVGCVKRTAELLDGAFYAPYGRWCSPGPTPSASAARRIASTCWSLSGTAAPGAGGFGTSRLEINAISSVSPCPCRALTNDPAGRAPGRRRQVSLVMNHQRTRPIAPQRFRVVRPRQALIEHQHHEVGLRKPLFGELNSGGFDGAEWTPKKSLWHSRPRLCRIA